MQVFCCPHVCYNDVCVLQMVWMVSLKLVCSLYSIRECEGGYEREGESESLVRSIIKWCVQLLLCQSLVQEKTNHFRKPARQRTAALSDNFDVSHSTAVQQQQQHSRGSLLTANAGSRRFCSNYFREGVIYSLCEYYPTDCPRRRCAAYKFHSNAFAHFAHFVELSFVHKSNTKRLKKVHFRGKRAATVLIKDDSTFAQYLKIITTTAFHRSQVKLKMFSKA